MNITKFDHRMRSMFSKCRCLINVRRDVSSTSNIRGLIPYSDPASVSALTLTVDASEWVWNLFSSMKASIISDARCEWYR